MLTVAAKSARLLGDENKRVAAKKIGCSRHKGKVRCRWLHRAARRTADQIIRRQSNEYTCGVKWLKITILLLFALFATLFLVWPAQFAQSFLRGIAAWAENVLPVLFPFALLTPFAVRCLPKSKSVSGKLFGIEADGIFAASLLCGYPVGAKLVQQSGATGSAAQQMCAFCSSAGPIFVATVGLRLLQSSNAALVLVVSNVAATFANGKLFARKTQLRFDAGATQNFSDALTSSVLALLCVGGLVAMFFVFADMVRWLVPQFCQNAAAAFVLGLFEMTSGILQLCKMCSLRTATVLCCFLSAFGGMCVFAQSMAFLNKAGVKPHVFLLMKTTQGCFATLFGGALSLLLL